jgi:hypothetical protein
MRLIVYVLGLICGMSKRLLSSLIVGSLMFIGSLCYVFVRFRANDAGRTLAITVSLLLGVFVTVMAYVFDDRRD